MAHSLGAQTTTATILGTVTDSSGAVVVNANVQVKNSGTGVTQTTMTDSQGRFIVADLIVGTYEVQASATGFQTLNKTGITLTVGGQSVVNFSLQVGQVQQTVTVESEAVAVETTTSEVSSVISPLQMSELPLNGRNFEQLIELGAGVQTVNTSNHQSFSGNTSLYSVAGARPVGSMETLDDTVLTTFWGMQAGSMALGTDMGVEAIGEFQSLTNTYSAQFGGNGAVLNASTKSGTNNFHGSLLEFFRNSGLDARNFNDGPSVPELRQNQFGGSLGGPIKKNKVFFFVDYEGLRRIKGQTDTTSVPDAAYRAGYVPNSAKTGYVPYTGAPTSTGNCSAVYVPGVSNCVTNPEVAAVLALYPETAAIQNGSLNGLQNQGIVTIPLVNNTTGTENYGVIRIDDTISDKDSIFGRYIIDWAYQFSPDRTGSSPIPYWPEEDFTHTQYYVLEERHLFSPTLINLARFAFSRPNQYNVSGDQACGLTAGGCNQFGANTSALDLFPFREEVSVSAPGASTLGDDQSHLPANLGVNRFDWGDDVLWTKGAHNIRFGTDVERLQYNDSAPFDMGGAYSFTSNNSFLAGSLSSATSVIDTQGPNGYRYVRELQLFPYVQDEWRVTPKLTANLGLRYEWMNNPSCRPCFLLGNGTVQSLQALGAQGPIGPNTGTSAGFYGFGYNWENREFQHNPSWRNIEPRIGLAYDPFPDHKTSIRAGFGEFYDLLDAPLFMPGLWGNPPDNSLTISNSTALTFPMPVSDFTLAAVTQNPAIISPNGQIFGSSLGSWFYNATPHMVQYNVNVQHEFWDHTIVSIGYVGSRGIDLTGSGLSQNPNIPNANGSLETFLCENNSNTILPCTTATGAPNIPAVTKIATQSNPTALSVVDLLQGNGLPAYSGVGSTSLLNGRSNYNSMQFTVNHPIRHDVQLNVAYTWSRSLDNGSAEYGFDARSANPESLDPYNFAANWGPSSFDVTNAVRVNGVIRLPFTENRLVSGWQMTPLFQYSSGSPVDMNGLSSWSGANGIGRPNIAPGCTYGSLINGASGLPVAGVTGIQWINNSCFTPQEFGFLGELGRDVVRAPGVIDMDLGFSKDTKITERYSIQFRAEFFNIFNWTNLGTPSAGGLTLVTATSQPAQFASCISSMGTTTAASCSIPSTSTGIITTPNFSGLSREIQLAVKVLF